MPEALTSLGEEGWELVAISPRSGLMGGVNHIGGSFNMGTGQISGNSTDFAGFTDEEIWAFKRPKE